MLGAGVSPWVIGANAGSIVLALIGFYQFVMKGLDKRIDYRVGGDLRAYMASEKKRSKKLRKALQQERSVLDKHMAHDEEVLAAASVALSEGQHGLESQLRAQHDELLYLYGDLTKVVRRHVKADGKAFARIEGKLE
jgi:hypothetical protein